MNIIDKLEPSEVWFVDRTGNLIIFYCKNNIRIEETCNSINQALRKLTKYRKKFENQRV